MSAPIKTIEILGTACPCCRETYRIVRHEVESAGLDVQILKSESVYRMIEVGVFDSPGIVIDGKVTIAGRIPTKEEIRKLLNVDERQAV
jgi:small redox-active disulfide protein 2